MLDTDADVVEIFSSIQGEGPHVGEATVFVRLGECDLRCAWCDSATTWLRPRTGRIEQTPGGGDFREFNNPLAVSSVLETVAAYAPRAGTWLSITGGEPLLQPDAVRALATGARGLGLRSHLETHGLAVDALATVIATIDTVSMDWKLASDVRRASDGKRGPVEPFHDTHARFLAMACDGGARVSVKIVVTPASTNDEIDEACSRVAAVDATLPLILQPVTPVGTVREAPTAQRMIELAHRCGERLPAVRVIPQTHRMLGAL